MKKIDKAYGIPGESNYHPILRNLDLKLGSGETLAILGPSGSGKTTLLNVIGTLDYPDEGEIFFEGENLRGFDEKSCEHFRNQKIGFVFQMHHLLPQLSLMENVLLPTLVFSDKTEKRQKTAYAEELLERVGIIEHRHKIPGEMSGGECQRAAVVRALINKPSILLADEPTGALDDENADKIANLLLDLNKSEGTALLVVSHSRELAFRMERVLRLKSGKLEVEKHQ